MTDWTSLVPVGGTGLRPGDCRSMASRFCTVALLFPSLYISPLSFLLTFLLLLRATTVPFRRGNVADSRPREIASWTVVFQCLIREGGARTGGWQEETPSGETRWRNSLFALLFSTRFSNEGGVGDGIEAWNSMEGNSREVRAICLGRGKGLFGWT